MLLILGCTALHGEDDPQKKHAEGSEQLGSEQDELSADVQQLVIEQTNPKVIELLADVEDIMDEATDRLLEADTGGETIAAQTEIIEKIYQAAKQKQSEGGGGQSGGAMMDMLEKMMGKGSQGEGQGKEGEKGEGQTGGKGQEGESDTGNEANGGVAGGKVEPRSVPKAAGSAGTTMPEEFRKALDAYNRGLSEPGTR
jgi:hypothetical protein